MATVYKIHPAIGIARLGNHESEFFVGPETPGVPGVEIGADGSEQPLTHYKAGGRVKRQAARFRVFAYDQDATGALSLIGELGPEARVEWTVDLVNRKAAFLGEVGPAGPRNTDIADRARLVIRGAAPAVVAGASRSSGPISGTFLGTDVQLGEVRTDAAGHLLVLGGRGRSASVPAGEPLHDFANNDRWHDDVSDGPVSATVTLPGQSPVVVHEQAWVVVAPPDFAPDVDATVTLYEIALQAAMDKGVLAPATRPSFSRDIRPLIERTLALRWVDDNPTPYEQRLPVDWETLADPKPSARQARLSMKGLVENPGLALFALPRYIKTYLTQWGNGDFDADLGEAAPAESLPEQLDRIALARCTGNNFLPGIDAGLTLKDPATYARPLRLDRTNTAKVYPGCLTEVMALPWQADFLACDGGVWWPTQRPDHVITDANDAAGSRRDWNTPIASYEAMVRDVMRLGFVVPQQVGGQTVFVEADRDPAFPRP